MSFAIFDKAIGLARTAGTAIKPHLPEIMVGVGTISVVGGAFLACKATLTVDAVFEEHTKQLEHINDLASKLPVEKYDSKAMRRDKTSVYAATAGALTKKYAPAIGLFVGGFGLIFGGFGMIRTWHTAACAAFAAMDEKFATYRGRVVQELGSEVDKKLLNGERIVEKVETTITDDDGNEKTVEKEGVIEVNPTLDDFTRVFDYRSSKWENSPLLDENFLYNQQKVWTLDLQSGRRNYLYIEKLCDALGLPEDERRKIDNWYGYTRKTGVAVDFRIEPFIIWDDDEKQFPLVTVLPVEYNENGLMMFVDPDDKYLFRDAFKNTNDDGVSDKVGYYIHFNVDTDENGIPREIQSEVNKNRR